MDGFQVLFSDSSFLWLVIFLPRACQLWRRDLSRTWLSFLPSSLYHLRDSVSPATSLPPSPICHGTQTCPSCLVPGPSGPNPLGPPAAAHHTPSAGAGRGRSSASAFECSVHGSARWPLVFFLLDNQPLEADYLIEDRAFLSGVRENPVKTGSGASSPICIFFFFFLCWLPHGIWSSRARDQI